MKGAGKENSAGTGSAEQAHYPLFTEDGMLNIKINCKCLYNSLILALVALVLFSVLPCPPVTAEPVLRLNPASGPVGTTVTISGTLFNSYEGDSIHILFDDEEIVAPVTILPGGSFTITWEISANATPGLHTISAVLKTAKSTFNGSADFTVDMRQLTLTESEGPVGTILNISGAGFYINELVTLSYGNPAPTAIGTVTASPSGKFDYTYTVPAGTAGMHKFTAADARGNTAEAVFRVKPDVMLSIDAGAPGEIINIQGSGFGTHGNVSILLDALNVAAAVADEYGSFTTEFTVPSLTLSTHYLKAQDNFNNKAVIAFPVTAGAILSGNSGAIGNLITVNGNGFKSGSSITVMYDDNPVASATADIDGAFTLSFSVPTSNGGAHIIGITDGVTTRHYAYTVETDAPPSPVPLIPGNKDLTGALTSLAWEPVTDPSLPVTYTLEIAADKDFTDIVIQKEGIPEAEYILRESEALPAEIPVSVYYWRVKAVDGAGNFSSWSEVWSLLVGVPVTPSVQAPAEGSTEALPLSLGWNPSSSPTGPVAYQLQVSRNSEFSELLINEMGITEAGYTIAAGNKKIFNKKIPYYWRVRAVDTAHNTSGWSATSSFNVLSTGFPAWAMWTLIGLGAVFIGFIIFRIIRRKAYRQDDFPVIYS